jgi:hypothetical protein
MGGLNPNGIQALSPGLAAPRTPKKQMGMNFLQPFRILMLARFSAEQTKDLETMLHFGHEGAIVRTGYDLLQPLIVFAPAHRTAAQFL